MYETEFTELAGRIEGVGRAVLQLAALLEAQDVIDGAQLSRRMRGAIAEPAQGALITARRTLHELARALDEARDVRNSFGQEGVALIPCADLLH